MKISVILAVYNEDKYLNKCLLSLSNQHGVDFEVLVLDDGSYKKVIKTDYSIKEDKRFIFYNLKHNGTAITRNFGAQQAKGEILVFLDGDMVFDVNFLKNLVQPIIDNKAKGTFSSEEFVANWNNVWARCWNYENGLRNKRRILLNKNMTRDFRSILKSEFDKVKGFDDIGYTDTWSLVKKLGYSPSQTKAKYFHYNPENYREVFMQAFWIGGRKRKLGIIGKIIASFRAMAPISLIIGILKSIYYHEFTMIKFKLIYDLGILGGAIYSMKKRK